MKRLLPLILLFVGLQMIRVSPTYAEATCKCPISNTCTQSGTNGILNRLGCPCNVPGYTTYVSEYNLVNGNWVCQGDAHCPGSSWCGKTKTKITGQHQVKKGSATYWIPRTDNCNVTGTDCDSSSATCHPGDSLTGVGSCDANGHGTCECDIGTLKKAK